MSYKEQIQNPDYLCKCMQKPVDKKNNDFCSTCFCSLLCFGPKFVITLPFWPFTIYNCLRNTCMKTENNNYIC